LAEQAVKIVFSDIDGTLLTDDKHTTPATERAVKGLLAQGIPFVLVSARMPEAIYPITLKWGLKTPVISYGGALVLTQQEEVLFDKRMARQDTEGVIAAIKRERPQATINYYAGRHWYVEAVDERVQHEMDITDATAEVVPFEALAERGESASKVLVMGEPEDCSYLQQTLANDFPSLNVVLSAPFLLEIMDMSVSKATGIEVMLKANGWRPEEALAFGDNFNDAEMLKYIPHSVVMGNAPEAVKKMGAAVTLTNEEDGIAHYLQKLGLVKL